MLRRLQIKNIALISEADIEFDRNLNVLSGETGAGKSVILDSINFVLGSKADKTMIRFGEQEASVRAEFCVEEDSAAAAKLRDLDIEAEGDIIISRRFSLDGKGAIKINGNAVTLSMLKSVTQHLVDVHGQSEHFFLLNEDNQLKVIDGICGEEGEAIKKSLAEEISKKRGYKSEIALLGGDESMRERTLDLLKYQIDEIERAELRAGEFEELKSKQNVIRNTEKILEALTAIHSLMSFDGGCTDSVSSARHYANAVSEYGEEYAKLAERLDELSLEAQDISDTSADMAENLNFDEGEAREIEERLELLKNLRKKYGADEEEILKFLENARSQFDAISDGAAAIERYEKLIAGCDERIYRGCLELTKLRKKACEGFCKDVTAELRTLNIADAVFSVEFNEYGADNADLNSANGSDRICFLFSANKGEPLKPLGKVISGGEMSRFMLAVKTVLKGLNGISTYIFDEIDAGISGFTARTIAEKFIKISAETQIIAVSHLPQICAASSSQFLIYKTEEDGKTLTRVKRLSEEEKISEIVRLTGSVKSPTAVKHAEELIKEFKDRSD